MEEEGVVILPTHRLVRGPLRLGTAALAARLGEAFDVTEAAGRRAAGEIDCVLPDRRLRLRPLPVALDRVRDLAPVLRGLEVELLRRAIIDPILGVTSVGSGGSPSRRKIFPLLPVAISRRARASSVTRRSQVFAFASRST